MPMPDDGRPPREARRGQHARHGQREPRRPRGPLGLGTRRRAYLAMMGVCVLLIVLAWTLIWRYSVTAAVVMSAVALCVPPFAAIVANAGPANRQ